MPGASRFTRRGLIVSGGAGIGLVVAWALWPRSYAPNLSAMPGEHVFGPFVKIGEDGRVIVALPQVEMGQGVYTTLPQIVADAIGADWRTVGVEPAPMHPAYANALLAKEWGTPDAIAATGQSTSVRGFEARLREAGNAARTLLCLAAAERWGVDARECTTADGFVVRAGTRLRFGALAADAAGLTLPPPDDMATPYGGRLSGRSVPRLDLPAKVDGSANYAADVRLPGMVFASIAQGPIGDTRLQSVDTAAAERVPGVLAVVESERWAAAVGTNWWAANRGVEAMRATFETQSPNVGDRSIARALDAPGAGSRITTIGDVGAAFRGRDVIVAEYRTGLAPHASIEPVSATAAIEDGALQLWIGTQAPGAAAAAAARGAGLPIGRVTVHPMLIGGSFGRRWESEAAEQVATIAARLQRPVQLSWSRAEDMRQDRFGPATSVRITARIGSGGRIEGWLGKVAAPATARALRMRVVDGLNAHDAMRATDAAADAAAVLGALPPYAIANLAIDHHPTAIGVPSGDWRGRAHVANAFAVECFVDELASVAGIDPFSYRMGLLGAHPRLANCLSRAAALGGWQGGVAGGGQGIACHMMAGSHVAILAEASRRADGRVLVTKLVAVVDAGRLINPDIVKQQIAGAMIFGMSFATGAPVSVDRGLITPTRLGALRLPRMADAPRIVIELIASGEAPGGVGEIAVPPTAPAIANALWTGGKRLRTLPLDVA